MTESRTAATHPEASVDGTGLGERDRLAAEDLLVGADSDETPTLSFVLPTLDEEEGIAECIDLIKEAVVDLGLSAEIVVSDSSSDRTPEIAESMGAIVVTPDEPGYGYAYRYGFRHARGDYVVMGDADTTYDFSELPRLFEHMQETGADIVMGSRLEGEIKDGAMPPLHQYVGNPLLTRFLNLFYDADVSDAHSGFRVLTSEALDALELRSDGMEFASEMVMHAAELDVTIEEVPITYHEREGEATLDSLQDGWRHVRFMLLNAPSYLFSVPGFALAGFGVLVMALCLTGTSIAGVTLGVHSMVAGSLFTLVGAQVGTLGLFATATSDPIREPADPVSHWIVENVKLEHGGTVGLLVLGAGATYGAFMVSQWVASGFTVLPMLGTDIVAMTAIVLGIQVVFNSFFMSYVDPA